MEQATARLWADADWRRYWVSRVVSYAGGTVTYVAAPILVYALTGSAFWTGVMAATEGLPYLLFGLVAGAFADRVDRRRLMVGADLLSAAVVGSVPLAWFAGVLTLTHVILVGLLFNTIFVFFDAANFGALPALVGRGRVGEANSAVWSATQLLDLLLPGAVGLALVLVDAPLLYVVDVCGALASALLIRGIRRALSAERHEPRSLRSDVTVGLRWLARHRTVLAITLLGTAASFASGGVMGQIVPFADQVGVRQGDWRLGAIYSAFALGGLAGTLSYRLLRRWGAARVALVGATASGALTILLSFQRDWRVATAVVVLWGAASLVLMVNSVTYRQEQTPLDLQGRVNTTGRMLSFGVGTPVGAFIAGAVAGAAGPAAGVLLSGLVLTAAAAAAWCSPLARTG